MAKRLALAFRAQKENSSYLLNNRIHRNMALRDIIQRCLVEGFNRALWQSGPN